MKVTADTAHTAYTPTPSNQAEAAILLGHQEAMETQKEAREDRRAAQRDMITHMKQVGQKLRQMANLSRFSTVLQGVVGFGSAALALSGVGADTKSLDHLQHAKSLDRLQTGLNLLGRADPFPVMRERRGFEKHNIETGVKQDEHREQAAGDRASEANRQAVAYRNHLQATLQAEHAARMASLSR